MRTKLPHKFGVNLQLLFFFYFKYKIYVVEIFDEVGFLAGGSWDTKNDCKGKNWIMYSKLGLCDTTFPQLIWKALEKHELSKFPAMIIK